MQTDARDPLNHIGSNDSEASCPQCGEPITGFKATARGTRNSACNHRISSRTSALAYGGVINA